MIPYLGIRKIKTNLLSTSTTKSKTILDRYAFG